jgi:hypothetical protein
VGRASSAIFVVAAALIPGTVHAQLPFEITRESLSKVDTASLEWRSLKTSVGGIEGEVLYSAPDPSLDECKAATLLGGLRMRVQYVRMKGEQPLTLRLDLHCVKRYEALLRFDGVMLELELRDPVTGAIIYQGRYRGLP